MSYFRVKLRLLWLKLRRNREGTRTDSSIQLVKFLLKSQAQVTQVLKRTLNLCSIDGFRCQVHLP